VLQSWKDAGNGQGIIATDGSEDDRHDTGLPRRQSFDTMSSLSSSDSSVAAHYAGDPSSQNPVKKLIARNLTAKGAADKLLRVSGVRMHRVAQLMPGRWTL